MGAVVPIVCTLLWLCSIFPPYFRAPPYVCLSHLMRSRQLGKCHIKCIKFQSEGFVELCRAPSQGSPPEGFSVGRCVRKIHTA